MNEERFIPCTREILIGDEVVYRPVRMWHSGTYAGERRTSVNGDGSGCLDQQGRATPPMTVVARIYWNVNHPEDVISAFLSYPNGMGCVNEYFWEVLGTRADGDIERFYGEQAESAMEDTIRASLGQSAREFAAAEKARRAREERPSRVAASKELIRRVASQLRDGKTLEQILAEQDDDPFVIQ